ncbi:hypothetical protein SS50377_21252 [Spironucleus salmonicida]|uniref:Uncharacterized protein n=1 Tax=Spironucleus salmonicida TaxID=348837 RepID=A0A9P8M0Z4_9EUKA|nr:hypothetical protein SS50377_21252 [Spironucleus salmonicida]
MGNCISAETFVGQQVHIELQEDQSNMELDEVQSPQSSIVFGNHYSQIITYNQISKIESLGIDQDSSEYDLSLSI